MSPTQSSGLGSIAEVSSDDEGGRSTNNPSPSGHPQRPLRRFGSGLRHRRGSETLLRTVRSLGSPSAQSAQSPVSSPGESSASVASLTTGSSTKLRAAIEHKGLTWNGQQALVVLPYGKDLDDFKLEELRSLISGGTSQGDSQSTRGTESSPVPASASGSNTLYERPNALTHSEASGLREFAPMSQTHKTQGKVYRLVTPPEDVVHARELCFVLASDESDGAGGDD